MPLPTFNQLWSLLSGTHLFEKARRAQEAEAGRIAEEARRAQEAEAARVAEETRRDQEAEAERVEKGEQSPE